MDKTPKVTILIPTYQQPNMVVQAVVSALSQNYTPLEVIVCDDNRDNETELALKSVIKADDRFTYIKNEVRLGRVANYRNALYFHASGEWVLTLDGDDYLIDPFFISDAIKGVQMDREIVLVQGGGEVRRENGSSTLLFTRIPNIDKSKKDVMVKGVDYVKHFPKHRHFLHLVTLFHRETALKIDFYRSELLSCDLESFMRLALHGKVYLLKRAVGVWRQHGHNAGHKATMEELLLNSRWVDSVALYAIQHQFMSKKRAKRWAKRVQNGEAIGVFVREINGKRGVERLRFVYLFLKIKPQLLYNIVFFKKLLEALLGYKNVFSSQSSPRPK